MRRTVIASLAAFAAMPAWGQAPPRDVPQDNPAGIRLRILAEGTTGKDPAARLELMILALEASLGPAAAGPAPVSHTGAGGVFSQVARQFAKQRGVVHLLLTSDKGGAICQISATPGPAVKDALPTVLQRCATELARQPPPAAPAAMPSGGQFPGNWDLVEGVYFLSHPGTGVGGMVIFEFRPLVLFRDGRYVEVDDAPLEDIDLAANQRARPADWGRWTARGGVYVLTDNKGRANDYKLQDGQFFKAFPASAATPLSGPYKRLSGGGNTALGGEMMIAVSSRFIFTADGRFTTGRSVGAIGSGDQSGVATSMRSNRTMPSPGRYTVDRHTLVLTYPDGRTERRFFAFASRYAPPQMTREMLFVGDAGYTSDD